MSRFNRFLEFMLSPLVILFMFVVGGAIGVYFPDAADSLAPYGDLFLNMLMMCVIPLMVAAIANSLAHVLRLHNAKRYFYRMAIVFLVTMFVVSIVSLLVAVFSGVGLDMPDDIKKSLGELVGAQHMVKLEQGNVFETFLLRMSPKNLGVAFAAGDHLSILAFSIYLGLALGLVTRRIGQTTLNFIQGFYHVMLRLISKIIYLLPYALVCIVASEVSKLGYTIFITLGKLVIVCYAGCIAMVIVQVGIVAYRTNIPYFKALASMKDSLVVAFVTSSSFPVIPLAIKAFHEGLRFNEDKANLFFPLGVTFNPQGTTFLIVLVSIYMMHLYKLAITVKVILTIILGSLLVSVAIGGLPFIAGLSMLAILFNPLGLPISVFIVIMVALSNVLDPIVTMANIAGNFMTVTLLPSDDDGYGELLFPHKNLYD